MDHAYRVVGDVSVEAGRGAGQLGWYRFFAPMVAGKSVIDIGCGLGAGLEILRGTASDATGQDLDERLAKPGVFIGPVTDIPSKSRDYVTCVDVVEHVQHDRGFMLELARIARIGVLASTPLSILGRAKWEYHIREYRFDEFVDLTAGIGQCQFFKGDPSGETVYPIASVAGFSRFHRLLNNPLTQLPARIAQKAVPPAWRNHGHQAVAISLS